MAEYKKMYKTTNGNVTEQLLQLVQIVWDGDLISKTHRDFLVKKGLAKKMPEGFNLITEKGLQCLLDLGLIHP